MKKPYKKDSLSESKDTFGINRRIKKLADQYQLEKILTDILDFLKDYTQANQAVLIKMADSGRGYIQVSVPACKKTAHVNASVFYQAFLSQEVVFIEDITPDTAVSAIFPEAKQAIVLPIRLEVFKGIIVLATTKSFQFGLYYQAFLGSYLNKISTIIHMAHIHRSKMEIQLQEILHTLPQAIVFVDEIFESGWINQAASFLLNIPSGKVDSVLLSKAMLDLRMSANTRIAFEENEINELMYIGQDVKTWIWSFSTSTPAEKVLKVSSSSIVYDTYKGNFWIFEDITNCHLSNLPHKQ